MKLFNYAEESVEIDVDLDDPSVLSANMLVFTGDEVLSVLYQDGSERVYDSGELTGVPKTDVGCFGYFDGSYTITVNGKWFVDREAFLSRKSSYWRDDG